MKTTILGATVLLACLAPQTGWATCRDKALATSQSALVQTMTKRLKGLGVSAMIPVGTIAKKDYYRLEGSKVRVFFVPDGDKVDDVGVLLSQPATPADTGLQVTLAGFVLSQINGGPDASTSARLASAISGHGANDKWLEPFDNASAVVTKTADQVLILMGQIDCAN